VARSRLSATASRKPALTPQSPIDRIEGGVPKAQNLDVLVADAVADGARGHVLPRVFAADQAPIREVRGELAKNRRDLFHEVDCRALAGSQEIGDGDRSLAVVQLLNGQISRSRQFGKRRPPSIRPPKRQST